MFGEVSVREGISTAGFWETLKKSSNETSRIPSPFKQALGGSESHREIPGLHGIPRILNPVDRLFIYGPCGSFRGGPERKECTDQVALLLVSWSRRNGRRNEVSFVGGLFSCTVLVIFFSLLVHEGGLNVCNKYWVVCMSKWLKNFHNTRRIFYKRKKINLYKIKYCQRENLESRVVKKRTT